MWVQLQSISCLLKVALDPVAAAAAAVCRTKENASDVKYFRNLVCLAEI